MLPKRFRVRPASRINLRRVGDVERDSERNIFVFRYDIVNLGRVADADREVEPRLLNRLGKVAAQAGRAPLINHVDIFDSSSRAAPNRIAFFAPMRSAFS